MKSQSAYPVGLGGEGRGGGEGEGRGGEGGGEEGRGRGGGERKGRSAKHTYKESITVFDTTQSIKPNVVSSKRIQKSSPLTVNNIVVMGDGPHAYQ